MDIGFIAPVNKTSGTPFNPSVNGASAPGFQEQINRAMRNYDEPKREQAVEKKPVGRKKPFAAAEAQNSTKAGEKTDAPKKNDRTDRKYTDNGAATGQTSDNTEEASQTAGPKFVLTGEDSGLYDESNDVETSETENVYTFGFPVEETSETENAYTFGFPVEETSETENAYTSTPPVEETLVPDDLADSSAPSSTDTLLFPSALINDDSGFAAMMSMNTYGETAPAGTEAISQMASGRPTAAPPPETTNMNVQQNASFSGNEAVNGAKELVTAMADELESADVKSAQPEIKEILENGLFPKNQAFAQNANRNTAASLRDESARYEIQPESKATVNAELELSKQSAVRASLENDALLMERMSVQTARLQQGTASVNAAENFVKTVQVAETSVHATLQTAKAEASVPTRSVSASDQEFVIELAGRIQSQIRGGREMIRIQLHPEELGRLEIRAESGRNGIIARIAAESVDVKKLLETNLQSLQQTLEARGLKVDRLHIIVEESTDASLFADGGRHGHAGTGPRNSEISEYSKTVGARIELPQEDDPDDLSVEAEQRGVGFYTVG